MRGLSLFENTPVIGDCIVFNPLHYKGLMYGACIGFEESTGLPIVKINEKFGNYGDMIPNNGFVILNKDYRND